MKKNEVIFMVLFAALLTSRGAKASANESADLRAETINRSQDFERLEETNALLQRLDEIGALEVDEGQNVKVKKSVLEDLRKQGRVKQMKTAFGIVCD